MNSFSDWKSGSTLGSIFNSVNNANNSMTTNHGSLEEALRGILGDQYGVKQKEESNTQSLEEAKKRAEELSKATDAVTKMAEELQEKINKEKATEVAEEPIDEPLEEAASEVVPSKVYRVFRDKDENFECKISIQGAGLSAAQVRIVFDTDSWNFTFYGKLYKDGRCIVPIKKGIPLQEGSRGRARLEVIVDEQLFIPWEDDFVVEGSKKVQVELKDQKSVRVSINSDNA